MARVRAHAGPTYARMCVMCGVCHRVIHDEPLTLVCVASCDATSDVTSPY